MAIAARHKTALRDYADAIGCVVGCATLGSRWFSALSLGTNAAASIFISQHGGTSRVLAESQVCISNSHILNDASLLRMSIAYKLHKLLL